MTKFKLYSLTAALLLSVNQVNAAPFGISMGHDANELEPAKPENKAFITNVPKPHPSFERYAVWATETTGVCLVIALSKTYDDDRYGNSVRADFEKFQNALTQKYGKSESLSLLFPDSIWDEPRDWVMAIRKNERVHAASWTFSGENQPENLEGIEMSVAALSSDSAWIRLQYQFNNFADCQKAIDDENNSSF